MNIKPRPSYKNLVAFSSSPTCFSEAENLAEENSVSKQSHQGFSAVKGSVPVVAFVNKEVCIVMILCVCLGTKYKRREIYIENGGSVLN